MDLEFEWDEAKNETNFGKHGIDFDFAIGIFEGFTIEDEDDRRDYGETRMRVIGETAGNVLLVVYTPREPRLRIISARKARRDERKRYYQALGQTLPE